MDHGVHATESIHLLGDAPHLVEVGDVAQDSLCATTHEIEHSWEPLVVTRVNNYLVPILEKRHSGCPAQTVRRTCDEYPSHEFLSLNASGVAASPPNPGELAGIEPVIDDSFG